MAEKLFRQFLAENKVFAAKEDNPLIYTLIIPKLVQCDGCKDTVKKDKKLFALIDKVEKMMGSLDVKQLKTNYSPIVLYHVFEQETTKKNMKDFIKQYFVEFEEVIAGEEVSFEDAYKIHSLFKDLTNSTEFDEYLKSL